jgi:hypothetical protein
MVWALLPDLIVATLSVVTPPVTLCVLRWTPSVLNCIPTQSVGTIKEYL